MKNIYLQLLEKQEPLVLATVTKASGSTPQKPGSSALIKDSGIVEGTVGGGSTEGEVIRIAKEVLKPKISRHHHFRFDNDLAVKDDEPICGGEEYILIDADPFKHFDTFLQLKKSLSQRTPGVLLTMITEKESNSVSITRYWMTDDSNGSLPSDFSRKLGEKVSDILRKGKTGDYREITFYNPARVLFLLEAIFPPPHLVIAGAGHIGRALAHLGSLLDFEITVIDDRPEYANNQNIPDGDHFVVEDIGEAMRKVKKGKDTFIVIVTRGHKDDRKALQECIGSNPAYIGMIGSRTKIQQIKTKFLDDGIATLNEWNKIHAPVGMDIRSQTVQEIAVSIAAQLVLIKNTLKNV